jgi:outer membrane receptor protein involved in Fe transport
MNIQRFLGATALVGVLSAMPAVAFAKADKPAPATAPQPASPAPQDTSTAAAPDDTQKDVVITGTRIRSPNVNSDIPITSISGDTVLKSGQANVGEALNNLPQLRSTFAQSNPGLGIGIAGLNLLDLRGLGTSRTLVLVDGRRHVAADILNNAVSPDINSIPTALVERVDIVTGGNSAVYGSDAIAGVVNFILRRDYDGLQLRGQAGVSEPGFGGNQLLSAMFGKNFGDGKGNITIAGEFTHQQRIFASDIPWYRQNNGFGTVDVDSAGLTSASDGFPDQIFLKDIRSATINPYGLIAIPSRPADATCGKGTAANNGGPNSNGTPYNCTFLFTSDGRLQAQTGSRYGSGPTGGILGGNGQTGREGQTLSVLPYLQRFNINALGHYTFAPALEVFFEAKWDRVKALGNNSGPSFIQTGSGVNGNVGDQRERPRLDNPFLNPLDRANLAAAILASNCNVSLTAGCPNETNIGTAANPIIIPGNLTPTDRAAIAAGTYRFQLARNLLDVGLRDEFFKRDTYRFVGGIRGTFNDDWSYELSANYGKFKQLTTTDGFIDRQRFSLAMDAGVNPVTGKIQCRSQFDPASAFAIQRPGSGDAAANAARLAADIAACVPYNPFGAGSGNAASAAYFSREFTAQASLEQLDFQGFVNGDTSGFFNLPGGPVRFALGGEYRREKALYIQDKFVVDGFTNGVTIPTFAPPAFVVKEAFGELQLPLVKDVFLLKELTVKGAARVSDYGGGVGTVWAYNYGAQWSPFSGIRFRANYGRAVRAPNVSETGSPLIPNFSSITDPCNTTNIFNNANRTKNCNTDLGALVANLPAITYSLPIVSGSNPNLQAEKSDSWTFGVVLTPRIIPGLALSIDYYNIKVKGIITSVAAQTILNNCYDFSSLNNIFCEQFKRFRGPGTGPAGEAPGAILGNSLIVAPLNFAQRVRKGIDVDFSYRANISSDVKFTSHLIYTHGIKTSNFEDVTNPTFENRILSEVGDPKDEFQLDADLTVGQITLGYRLHYISPQYITTYENFNPLNGNLPLNADATSPIKYPAVSYSDVRLEWNLANGSRKDAFQFYFGVNNIFKQLPPLGTTATGTGTAIFDYRGRNFFAGFRVRY